MIYTTTKSTFPQMQFYCTIIQLLEIYSSYFTSLLPPTHRLPLKPKIALKTNYVTFCDEEIPYTFYSQTAQYQMPKNISKASFEVNHYFTQMKSLIYFITINTKLHRS